MLPEIWRATRIDLKRNTAIAAAAMVTVVCGAIVAVIPAEAGYTGHERSLSILLGLQLLAACGISAARAFTCFSSERSNGTWDMLRLTPQSALTLTLGKFGGSWLLAGYVSLWFTPWVIWSAWHCRGEFVLVAATAWITCVGGAFLLSSAALLSSTIHRKGLRRPAVQNAAGIVVVPLFIGVAMSYLRNKMPIVGYYGHHVPTMLFITLSCVAYGIWALFAAKWTVGRSLLERGNGVRIPLFIVFLTAYMSGFFRLGWRLDPDQIERMGLSLVPAAIFIYLAAFFTSADTEHWRLWLTEWTVRRKFDDAPVTVLALPTFVVVTVLLACSRGIDGDTISLILSCTLLMTRDLAILQAARFSNFRNPEALAVGLIAIVWVIPTMVAKALELSIGAPTSWLVPLQAPPAATAHAAVAVAGAVWLYLRNTGGLPAPVKTTSA